MSPMMMRFMVLAVALAAVMMLKAEGESAFAGTDCGFDALFT